MTLLRWADVSRETLNEALPEALVVLPVGATEQHGRHLATGTDALLAATAAERAAAVAAERAARSLVLAPTLWFGASDHHLPFGGTLSLTPETLLAVLVDLLRSVAESGGRRVVLVNGHGGNVGVCHAAAAAASTRHRLAVAHVDYWRFAGNGGADGVNVPGHAGEFETSLVAAVRPEAATGPAEPRETPPHAKATTGATVHAAELWSAIDGYTDHPERASAEHGGAWLDTVVAGLADCLAGLTETL
ncbi:creatininase family protein [Jiangella mangrovi]|uniref:Creatinine amidohydrolase n=1 Tax=Jiangella mangrovi TaxID=1524084 RepID=A0A7W9GVT0_9ACTN|nr:creatininase family protein [Jiangella mangrovi]MBB5790666.1 creatinine amidohydrolase [Jiangella mangrovi]